MRDGYYYTFWVYIMGSRTGTLYTGMTGFFARRVGQHKKKIALIEKMNPRWQDLAEHWGREMLLPGQSLKKTP